MANLFNNYVFEPILSLLIWVYQNISLGDLGLAIIILTLLIRVVLLPFFYKSSKDQALIRKIQPKVNEIKKKYKEDKEKQGKELMNLYKEHKLNPFSGFLLLIIQLPIFFALFRIFRNPELITETFNHVTAFGLINLTEIVIPVVAVAAILQYFQGKISLAINKTSNNQQNNNPIAKMGNSMVYIAPILSFVILIQLPSALAVYWITSSLFSIGQQFVINKKIAETDEKLENNKKENGKNN
jgi:YidC/Oxa1 family membrane protein insertase